MQLIWTLTSAASLYIFWLVCLLILLGFIGCVFFIGPRLPARSFLSRFLTYRVAIFTGILSVFITLTIALLTPTPQLISPRPPLFDPLTITPDSPLTLTFDRPISPQIDISIHPPTAGTWQLKGGKYPFLNHQAVFNPQESFQLDTEYALQIDRILPITWVNVNAADSLFFIFTTPPLPQVAHSRPEHLHTGFKVDQPLVLEMDAPIIPHTVLWQPILSPDIQTKLTVDHLHHRLIINPEKRLDHQTQYHLSLTATPIIYDYSNGRVSRSFQSQPVADITFTTVKPAALGSISPSPGKLLPLQPLILNFAQAMDRTSVATALSIFPSANYRLDWPSATTVEIIPQPAWELDGSYSLRLDTQAMAQEGGYITEAIEHNFSIIGPITLSVSDPADHSPAVPVDQTISLTFDQPVDPDSAPAKFTLTPPAAGTFSYQDNILVFTPDSPLAHQTRYTLSLDPGIVSIHGLDSQDRFSVSFTTTPQRFVLDLPYRKQQFAFTCYSTAAQMALAYRGIMVDQVGFLNDIGWDNTPRNFNTNTWGDPNQGVVGSIDGSGSGGYGAHWGPVAQAMQKYTPVEVKTNWDIPGLIQEINRGNPVIIWWVNGVWPAKDVSWNTPSGQRVYTVNGMHTEVVKGYIGAPDDPAYIITADPWRGERRYTPASFNHLWRWFNYTAIVVK